MDVGDNIVTPPISVIHRLIYVLEDDDNVAQLVVRTLKEFGFSTEHMTSGRSLLRKHRQKPAELCIVDLGLPDMDGLTVVRQLNDSGNCAIIILTGRQELSDRVTGLELGADDYIIKPFEPRELIARVRSALRRVEEQKRIPSDNARARFAGWMFDVSRQQLKSPDGQIGQLGTAETQLLLTFLRSPNRILTREQLLPDRTSPPIDRTIDARISRLRKRLDDEALEPRIIKTIYGAGYMFAVDVEWDCGSS